MGDKIQRKIVQFLREEKHKRKLKRIVGIMAVVVVFCTTYALILPAITMSDKTYCDMEEHTHGEECYTKTLTCDIEENDETGHVHTDDCYSKELSCGLEEHTHTLICYSNPEADTETQEVWEKTLPKEDELTGEWNKDVVAIAESQLGYAESTENYNVENDTDIYGYTRYGAWYGNPYEEEWSTTFVLFCLNNAGISDKDIPYSDGCEEWADKLADKKMLEAPEDYEAEAGDIVLFDTDNDKKADHAGIITEVNDGNKLVVIEGDSDNKVQQNKYKTDAAAIYGYVKLPSNVAASDTEEAVDTENTTEDVATDEAAATAVEATERASGEITTDEAANGTEADGADTEPVMNTLGDEGAEPSTEVATSGDAIEAATELQVEEVMEETAEVKDYHSGTSTSTTTVNVNKVWDDTKSHTYDEVTVILYKDGVEYDSQVLNRSNSWKYSWTNLPDDGDYTVAEDVTGEDVKGYTPIVSGGEEDDAIWSFVSSGGLEDGETYAIAYYDSNDKLQLLTAAGAGNTLDATSGTLQQDSSGNYYLSSIGAELQWTAEAATGSSYYLKNTSDGTTQYMDLEYTQSWDYFGTSSTNSASWERVYYDASTGALYIYDSYFGYYYYFVSVDSTVRISMASKPSSASTCFLFKKTYTKPTYNYTITNTPTIKTGDSVTTVKVKKSWADGSNKEVVVHLLDEKGNRLDSEYGVKKLNSSNGFQAEWADLPDAVYTVEEDEIDGYEATVSSTRSQNTIFARCSFSDFDEKGTYAIGSKTSGSYYLWSMGASGTVITRVKAPTTSSSSVVIGGQTYTDYFGDIPINEQFVFKTSLNGEGYYIVRDAATKLNSVYYSSSYLRANASSSHTISFSDSNYLILGGSYYIVNSGSYMAISSTSATAYYLFKKITDTTYEYTITNTKKAENTLVSYEDYSKTIDALRSGTGSTNTDTTLASGTDLTDLYRLYLNVGPMETKQGVDLLLVVDESGSMSMYNADYNRTSMQRDQAVTAILNGDVDSDGNGVSTDEGLINEFLALNKNNRYAVVEFSGNPNNTTGSDDAALKVDWTNQYQTVNVKGNDFDGAGAGTNYSAGYKLAETMFEELEAKDPGSTNKKVMLFISDGVPTYYFNTSGAREGNGGTEYHNEDDCINPTVDNFKSYFTDKQSDVTVYTVGMLAADGDNSNPAVLRYMAKIGNGEFINASDGNALSAALEKYILGGGKYSDVVIKDELSEYVDMYTTQPDFKLTMTTNGNTVTLWEGDAATSDGAGIIESVAYDEDTRTVTAKFYPTYKLEINSEYALSFNVRTSDTAYNETAENLQAGKDRYAGTVGDADTDYSDNSTSSNKGGFRSNKEAVVTYVQGGKAGLATYDHPVVQTATCELTIKKVSQDNQLMLLEGAEFDLYRAAYKGESNTVTGGSGGTVDLLPTGSYVKVNSSSITTGALGSNLGTATVSNLEPGEYYLIETKAPEGYILPTEALKFTLTRSSVTVETKTGEESLLEGSSESTVLTVKNDSGKELPQTGGPGTIWYIVSGAFLMICSLVIYKKFCKR